jgi:hypothetical protein
VDVLLDFGLIRTARSAAARGIARGTGARPGSTRSARIACHAVGEANAAAARCLIHFDVGFLVIEPFCRDRTGFTCFADFHLTWRCVAA